MFTYTIVSLWIIFYNKNKYFDIGKTNFLIDFYYHITEQK